MPPTSPVEERVFLLLGQNYSMGRKLVERSLSPLHITLSEYSFLRIVENHPSISASEIGRRLGISAPSAAEQVKTLLRKGRIVTVRDSGDVRRRKISLTAKGSIVTRRARSIIRQMVRKAGIPESVLHSLLEHLTILSTSLSSYGD